MADNITILDSGGTPRTVSTDELSGPIHVQRNKVTWGVDGVSNDVSATNPFPVSVVQQILTHHRVLTGTSADAVNVKASAGQLKFVYVFNNAGYPIFVKLHNTAGVPTPGAGVVLTVGCQAGQFTSFRIPDGGRNFTAGIAITVVRGILDTDTEACAANDGVVEVGHV